MMIIQYAHVQPWTDVFEMKANKQYVELSRELLEQCRAMISKKSML